MSDPIYLPSSTESDASQILAKGFLSLMLKEQSAHHSCIEKTSQLTESSLDDSSYLSAVSEEKDTSHE